MLIQNDLAPSTTSTVVDQAKEPTLLKRPVAKDEVKESKNILSDSDSLSSSEESGIIL